MKAKVPEARESPNVTLSLVPPFCPLYNEGVGLCGPVAQLILLPNDQMTAGWTGLHRGRCCDQD